jgi:hypothetical protein
MLIEERRTQLSRLMLGQPDGLAVIMARYSELAGRFPSQELSPRQIIAAILAREYAPHLVASGSQPEMDASDWRDLGI